MIPFHYAGGISVNLNFWILARTGEEGIITEYDGLIICIMPQGIIAEAQSGQQGLYGADETPPGFLVKWKYMWA